MSDEPMTDAEIEALAKWQEGFAWECQEPRYSETAQALRQQQAEIVRLRDIAADMVSGLDYVRSHHGSLPDVGWDRVTEARRALIPHRFLAEIPDV